MFTDVILCTTSMLVMLLLEVNWTCWIIYHEKVDLAICYQLAMCINWRVLALWWIAPHK